VHGLFAEAGATQCSLAALAGKGPVSPMMRRSKQRSSPSPPILKRISISTGCSRLRDNKRDQGQTREMDAAGAAVETERALMS